MRWNVIGGKTKTEKTVKCVITWHLHSIHHHIFHVQQAAQRSLHLSGGHVLSFPAERVSCAVFEIHVAVVVHHQHVPWERRSQQLLSSWVHGRKSAAVKSVSKYNTWEIGTISLFEDIVGNLFISGRLIDVAVKSSQRVVLNDSANQLTRFSWETTSNRFYIRLSHSL